MSRNLAASFFVVLALLLVAPPAHAQESKTYDVSAFDELYVAVHGTAHVRQGSSHEVRLEGPREMIDKIEVSDRGGRLRIEYEDRGLLERLFGGSRDIDDDDAVDVYVTMPTVRELAAGGAATLKSESTIESESLRLEASGASNLDVDVSASTLRLHASGAGDATIRGTADDAEIHASGAGTVRAEAMTVRTATVEASGAGSAYVHVTDRLSAEASGAGSIHYRGTPEVSMHKSGAGSVSVMK